LAYDVEFYQKENGEIPLLDFLESLPPKLRAKTFREIELLKEHGPNLREPYTKPLKGQENRGIFELRIKLSTDISRILYFSYTGTTFVLLHGFVKKTNATPSREIVKARKFKEDYERRFRDE
jgi:phage-related protein